MDQVTPPDRRDYSPVMVEEFGYDREAVAFLGISRLKGVGFQTLFGIGGRSGITDLLEAHNVTEVARRISVAPNAPAKSWDWDELNRKIFGLGRELAEHLAEKRVRFLFSTDARFPRALATLPDELRPRWLFVAGDLELLERRCIAVVGTRDPTQDGEFLARYAVACAREVNAPVVSGLAHGVDRLVHEWCLRLSVPTISVLGTGILEPYPAKHVPLGNAILEAGGTLMTEYLPMQRPSAQQFVWRNRLQAALSLATVPVEWKRKSGTAHTVRFSRKLKRPVIGLRLDGIAPDPEAGEPDHIFAVPREHGMLIEALTKALLAGGPMPDGRQQDLFS
jgi:DNA processing protein